jgi:hypothetical protein
VVLPSVGCRELPVHSMITCSDPLYSVHSMDTCSDPLYSVHSMDTCSDPLYSVHSDKSNNEHFTLCLLQSFQK